jgi:ubiquinone/menaquinone biosynthesis C-methylase UbiE
VSLKSFLNTNTELENENGLYFQKNLRRKQLFEREYIALREKENRIYSDEDLRKLPSVSDSKTQKEWKIRKHSADKLCKYLQQKKPASILELGCGNGWLCNYLSQHISAEICGVDINETELSQAARVFSSDRVSFVYADIFTDVFSTLKVDVVILASSIQYFSDVRRLIRKLQPMLTADGEIQIIDSPLYENRTESLAARQRSELYFTTGDHVRMREYYFHHCYQDLDGTNYQIQNHKASGLKKLFSFATNESPFPWIRIKKSTG